MVNRCRYHTNCNWNKLITKSPEIKAPRLQGKWMTSSSAQLLQVQGTAWELKRQVDCTLRHLEHTVENPRNKHMINDCNSLLFFFRAKAVPVTGQHLSGRSLCENRDEISWLLDGTKHTRSGCPSTQLIHTGWHLYCLLICVSYYSEHSKRLFSPSNISLFIAPRILCWTPIKTSPPPNSLGTHLYEGQCALAN